jgi:hypothetical protein
MGRHLILLMAAALTCSAAAAAPQLLSTHTLIGAVTDSSGRALPGVTIDLSRPAEANTVRTVVTDVNGRYRIEKVLPGAYVLAFRLPGFGSAIRDIDIGGGGPEFEYDVQLTPAAGGRVTLPTGPSRKVVCGMTVVTPPAGIDPGIQAPRSAAPPGAVPVKPAMRVIQPTMCWEPTTDSRPVPPRQ